MSKQTEALKLALEALEEIHPGNMTPMAEGNWSKAIIAIREALAEQPAQQEPVREMPSNTRYAVAVEGHALTYWDNVHDAITNAQRAVYAGPDATCRAIDDLKAGRLAEWSYGFSAVCIYPPQNTSPPASKPWVGLTDEERSAIFDREFKQWWSRHDAVCRAIEAKLREKNA
jgi:hypothetical protein